MAITNSDGTIMLSVQVDEQTLKKALKGVENSGKKINSTFSKIGTTISKGFTLAATSVTAAIVGITKQSVSAYAEYEQLVGGVETLFKGASDKVKAYAEDAFYTAGVSANEYMQQVTSFSASLISSCAGDTDKAADIANMALIDISDNVNKMGSSMESVTLAYQGFAKQQYMLLDNLKLGYGGTKTEMQRLLKDAQAITNVKYDIDNLADVYNALHVIQEQLDITGTTAKEAATTVQGSENMMKASWQDVLAAISGGGDLDRAINNLVYSITTYFDNISPVVQRALIGVGQVIEQIAPMLAQNVAIAIVQSIPSVVNAIYAMFISAAKGIWAGIKAIFTGKSSGSSITAQLNKTTSGTKAMADSIGTAADNQDKLTKGVKGTNKELKKTLAGFDELQILSDTSSTGGSGGSGGSGTDGGIGGISVDTPAFDGLGGETGEDKIDVNPWKSAIKGLVEVLVGTGLIALGIILCAKGNLKWGIGAIIFGLMSIGAGTAKLGKAFDASSAKDIILIITGITGFIMLSLGVILLFLGNIPWGIGALIGGIALLGYTAYQAATKLNTEELMSFLSTFLAFLGGALLAIGVILCWLGSLPVGIACIIAGVASLVGAGVATSKSDSKSIEKWLLTIMTAAGGALLALGIMITMFGGFSPLGIGLIVAGAAILAVALINKSDSVPDEVKNWINGIFAIVSVAALVIGIIMLCCGQITPLSIGLVVVGAIGLAAELAINWNYLKDKVSQFIDDNAGLIVGIAIALVVIGIILICTGVGIPLGIGLIVAGGAAIATEVVLNWDFIKEKVSNGIDAIGNWIKTWGLLVLGVILCVSGVGIPLGIGLIKKGGANLTEAQDPMWTTFKDKVKEVWESIQEYWKNHIAKYFTAAWWKDLATTAIKSFANCIIEGLNKLIRKINGFGFDMPDKLGGGHIGFKIPEIPKLAKGAVIPANREFLAVLGDQKHGTNVEAPAELIKQMAIDAYQEMGLTGGQNQQVIREEHYYLDRTELMRIVYDLYKGGERLNGTSLIQQGGI